MLRIRHRAVGRVLRPAFAPLVLAAGLGTVAGRAFGQSSGTQPFITLGSRLDRLVAWAIDEGSLSGLDPTARPFRPAAVRRALQTTDTVALDTRGRRAIRWLAEALALASDSNSLVAEVAVAGYTNGRRDSFRWSDSAGVAPAGGLRAALARGSLVVVLNPAIENRLLDDPEYTGYTKRVVAGRIQEGYVALSAERGDLLWGRLASNWGPDLFDGLLVSPSVYSIDALMGALRIGRFALTSVAQRLDDHPDTGTAIPITRYSFAHRVSVRAGRDAWLGFTEAGVYGGPGRGFEPTLHAPLNLALLSEFNDGERVNVLVGADAAAHLDRRSWVYASGFVDDIQVDRGQLSERRPTSYGLSVVARRTVGELPVHVALGYTRVSSLAYRNGNDRDVNLEYRGIGLGRNFSDYDQVLLRLEVRPRPAWYVAADLSYLRQGAGDFRQPYPPDSALAKPGQGFLLTPVRSAPGVRVTVNAETRPGWELRGEIGATRQLGGDTKIIASLSGSMRYDALRRRFGGAVPALAPGGNRGWP